MKTLHMFFILCISTGLAGCFPATQNTSNNNHPQNYIYQKTDTTHNSGECTTKSAKSGSDSSIPPSEGYKKTAQSQDLSQEDIDRALELCDSAQTFWEKGELENALIELDTAYSIILNLDLDEYPELNQQKEDIRFMISKRILEIYASRHIIVNGKHNPIPITLNKYVEKEIKRLTGPERNFFLRSVARAGRYRPYITAELKKAGLPEELSWLPLIESGFKIDALSPARALGLWQFIPSTGYKFGLKRNYYVDERLDPIKSTKAAISYLSELHKIFGDWSTVLAAYNCGEGRVLRIIRNQRINYLDNFWDLYQKLPRETARYVPRFLATLHIMNNLPKYNITLPKSPPPLDYKTFTINKQIRLADLAAQIGISTKTIKELNPELKYNLLPPEKYQIRIPADKANIFLASLGKIKPSYSAPTRYAYHRVKQGDTLSSIADRYGSCVNSITTANRIPKNKILHVGQVLKVPGKKSDIAYRKTIGSKKKFIKKPVSYTVRRGDNLWLIAREHGTTTKAIIAANNLRNTELYIKQKLTIPYTNNSKIKIKAKKIIVLGKIRR